MSEHLGHFIKVSGDSEKYLRTLRLGLSDDQVKREVEFGKAGTKYIESSRSFL